MLDIFTFLTIFSFLNNTLLYFSTFKTVCRNGPLECRFYFFLDLYMYIVLKRSFHTRALKKNRIFSANQPPEDGLHYVYVPHYVFMIHVFNQFYFAVTKTILNPPISTDIRRTLIPLLYTLPAATAHTIHEHHLPQLIEVERRERPRRPTI